MFFAENEAAYEALTKGAASCDVVLFIAHILWAFGSGAVFLLDL